MKYQILHLERGKQSMLGFFLRENYVSHSCQRRCQDGQWVAGGWPMDCRRDGRWIAHQPHALGGPCFRTPASPQLQPAQLFRSVQTLARLSPDPGTCLDLFCDTVTQPPGPPEPPAHALRGSLWIPLDRRALSERQRLPRRESLRECSLHNAASIRSRLGR